VIVKKGETIISMLGDTVERWGDYTGIQRKYNEPGYVWLNGSLGKQNVNLTWVSRVRNTDPISGIRETAAGISSTKLYPNPAHEYVQVDFQLEQGMILEFDLMSMNGQRVTTFLRDKGKAGLCRFSFRTDDIPNGNYILNIRNGQQIIHSSKIVVAH
jgi:hypothetical protein